MKSSNIPKILIIDDDLNNIKIIFYILENAGYQLLVARNGNLAATQAKQALPDLILLDVIMPGIDGFQTCLLLKSLPETQNIPIIFMTGVSNLQDKVKAFELGAVDYVTKPFEQQELIARINLHLELKNLTITLQEQNNLLQQEIARRTLAEAALTKLNQELETKVKERTLQLRNANKQLYNQAFYDCLTQLPNRAYFLKKLSSVIELSQRDNNYFYAVLFIDLNRFKIVNDSLGHEVGDKLLKQVAIRLRSCSPSRKITARFGGDEFLILLKINSFQEAEACAEDINQRFREPFLLKDYQLYCYASIGITSNLIKKYTTSEEVVKDADIAMYGAKQQNNYVVFKPEMQTQIIKSMKLEHDLHQAIENQELLLYYQPIISLSTGLLTGFEALIRWQHPTRGLVSPGEFIPLAEETGLIYSIGNWVISEACRQINLWLTKFPDNQTWKVNVNVSSIQLKNRNLIGEIQEILTKNMISGKYLQIEITESFLIDRDIHTKHFLEGLKHLGIGICIDDFGTGYSCLSILHNFSIDELKIDRSFLKATQKDKSNIRLIQLIISLAHSLNTQVVGEGISHINQLRLLQQLGCELGQGYLFSPPVDSHQATRLLANLQQDWLVNR